MLHIQDTNPLSLSANGWLEDTSKVEKYVMSDEAYNAREGTYRKYKEMKLKVGQRRFYQSLQLRPTLTCSAWLCSLHPLPQCSDSSNRQPWCIAHQYPFAGAADLHQGQQTSVVMLLCFLKKLHWPFRQDLCRLVSNLCLERIVLADHPMCCHAQEDPTWTAEKELAMRNGRPYNPPKVAERVSDANHLAEEASSISVGDRCAVAPGDKRGTVR